MSSSPAPPRSRVSPDSTSCGPTSVLRSTGRAPPTTAGWRERSSRPVATEIYMRSRSEIGDWAERILAITPPDDDELIVFGLTWAARRYMRNRDIAGYERLVGRYGEPDDPMIRYARGVPPRRLRRDGRLRRRRRRPSFAGGTNTTSPTSTSSLRLGLTLLMSGQLAEHDTLVTELAERYRAHGPPTCLQWALTQLGISASLQGRHHDAERYYEGAASVDVPDRTHTLKSPLEARAAFRRGDRPQAFELLRSYVDELLDNDNMYVGRFACDEFVRMMVKVDRRTGGGSHPRVPRIDRLTRRRQPQVTPRRRRPKDRRHPATTTTDHERSIGRNLDDRQALTFIRDVLDQLLDGAPGQQLTAVDVFLGPAIRSVQHPAQRGTLWLTRQSVRTLRRPIVRLAVEARKGHRVGDQLNRGCLAGVIVVGLVLAAACNSNGSDSSTVAPPAGCGTTARRGPWCLGERHRARRR